MTNVMSLFCYSLHMKLDPKTVATRLSAASEWTLAGDTITRQFKFADFKAAFAFMSAVAPVADRLNHHPEWSNVYNRVTITLTTHDAGGLSELDFELARAIDRLASDTTA